LCEKTIIATDRNSAVVVEDTQTVGSTVEKIVIVAHATIGKTVVGILVFVD
jgi:hypothetical protein